VAANGDMLGVMETRDAMRMAIDQKMDLVEISPNADPPVCRIMDFGKFRYEESMRNKKQRKTQSNKSMKEVKFHANVGEHDFQTKLNKAKGFLEAGHKVKLSLQFRGRENAHRELGFEVIKRVIAECVEISVIDMAPKLMGRSIVAMLGVKTTKGQKGKTPKGTQSTLPKERND
jgi:translation initiation factor IF-3